jgi:hypothetical protein
LGGVPFEIPTQANNYWHSEHADGDNPRSIDIFVGRPDVREVHTLINTYWGQSGPGSYAWLEFFGSDGAYFRKDLVGNEDIRDFNQLWFTNSINGTTTVNVVLIGSHRLDKQAIALPADFQDEELSTIRLSDNGAYNWQRVFLAGVTVAARENLDCNDNTILDECEPGSGDMNGDGYVDALDYPALPVCMTGPCEPGPCVPPLFTDECCILVDADEDGDVDLEDFAAFQLAFGSP